MNGLGCIFPFYCIFLLLLNINTEGVYVYVKLNESFLSLLQILKPADKKLYPYGGGGGMGSGRPVTPPRNSAKSAKAKK